MQKAADFFERLRVPYRIVGSMASMAYSEARFTNDIDILVDLQEEHAGALEREFPFPDYYVSVPAAREAIRTRHQFNIGQRLRSEGFYDAWFGAPENLILMKMLYFKEGGSDKHLAISRECC